MKRQSGSSEGWRVLSESGIFLKARRRVPNGTDDTLVPLPIPVGISLWPEWVPEIVFWCIAE